MRLRDVGRAELGAADERRERRFNGRNAVAMGIVKQATANPLDVSNAVRARRCRAIRDGLPEGMSVDVGYDSSVFIDELDRGGVPHDRARRSCWSCW